MDGVQEPLRVLSKTGKFIDSVIPCNWEFLPALRQHKIPLLNRISILISTTGLEGGTGTEAGEDKEKSLAVSRVEPI